MLRLEHFFFSEFAAKEFKYIYGIVDKKGNWSKIYHWGNIIIINFFRVVMVKQMAKQIFRPRRTSHGLAIKPLGDRIVVKSIKEAEKTKSGIILPETADKEKPAQGKVMAIGAGDKIKKSGIKKGDEVVFEKYAGTEFKIGDIEYKILKEDEVLAILE